jgi:nucleoside-triphosphatase
MDTLLDFNPVAEILLVRGRPGVGKTTLARRLVEAFPGQLGGFYTEEVRLAGRRVGFELVTVAGGRALFAHVRLAGAPHRVGRYGVDLQVLDRVGVPAVREAARAGRGVVVDEIGKMELASPAFREALEEVASGPAVLVATVLAAPHPWAEAFRRRPGVTELVLSAENREEVFRQAREWLAARLVRKPAGAPGSP